MIADALVYPVSIGYKNGNDGVCLEAAYMDPSLALSLQQILTQTQINTDLFFGEPIPSGMKNRRELARMIETTIAQTLSLPIRHKQLETTLGLPIWRQTIVPPKRIRYPKQLDFLAGTVRLLTNDRTRWCDGD